MSLLEERIYEARQESGITASNLARMAGVTSAAVSRWEKGQVKNLRMEHLFVISRLLDVNPEWLATGRGRKKGHLIQRPNGIQETPPPSYDQLNQEEQLLINIYRRLSHSSRESLKEAITEWFDKTPKNTRGRSQ
jgi:transcriptional regulator with XRE-family HTH domain